MDAREIVREIRRMGDPAAVEGMKRFGISANNTFGVSVPKLRLLAKKVGKGHQLALDLWDTGVHEARILASMVDEPGLVTAEQMDRWAKDFDSWDVCDGTCGNLFDKTRFAYAKAMEWSRAEPEYLKRAGFTLMAVLAVHDKSAPDERFGKFFGAIKKGSKDERNFVKKAVNWALRQIGKRNVNLNRRAVKVAGEIGRIDSRSARWVSADALRELRKVQVAPKRGKRS